jgi:hypothetical protein
VIKCGNTVLQLLKASGDMCCTCLITCVEPSINQQRSRQHFRNSERLSSPAVCASDSNCGCFEMHSFHTLSSLSLRMVLWLQHSCAGP